MISVSLAPVIAGVRSVSLQDTTRDSGCTIQRLEKDKQSLTLQVSVLSDQVEAQSEKIRELEYYNNERRLRLQAAEEMLESVGENYLILSLKKNHLFTMLVCLFVNNYILIYQDNIIWFSFSSFKK